MNILKISISNLKSKPFYTFLGVFVLALSIALLLGVKQLKKSFNNQIDKHLAKIDMVIGAKGSPLQLVLASVLHLDDPTGNISYNAAKKIVNHPLISSAIPISYGDNYKNYRIIGTTNPFMSLYDARLASGRLIQNSLEVVLGSNVANHLELKLGDTFFSSHGLIDQTLNVHSEKFTVVGVLAPTQKVIDGLIITSLESIWDVHESDAENMTANTHAKHYDSHDDHDHGAEEMHRDITSLLVSFKSPRAYLTIPRKINKTTRMQAVLPKYELNKLYEYTSIGFETISLIAYIILIISCTTIFISLYKMVKERAFDLAILRTYGASNLQLILMLLYEGLIIIVMSFILGVFLIKIAFYIIGYYTESNYHKNILVELSIYDVLQLVFLICILVIIAIVLAIYPLIKMNISTILSHEK